MQKKTRFFFYGGFLYFFVLAAAPFAAGEEMETPPSFDPKASEQVWQEGIFAVKDSARALIKENERLNDENNGLVAQFLALQKKAEEAKQESLRLTGEPARLTDSIEGESRRLESLQNKAQELEKRIPALQKENAALKERLARAQKKAGFPEKGIADLTAEKANLMLELKLTESLSEEKVTKLYEEVEALKSDLSKNQSKEMEESAEEWASDSSDQEGEEGRAAMNGMGEDLRLLASRIFDLTKTILALQEENAAIEKLLDTKPDEGEGATEIEAMAYAFALQGQNDEAIKRYEEALKKGGDEKNIYFNLGSIYSRMGNIEEAKENYRSVLKIDPKDHETKRILKELLQKQKSLTR